MIIAEISQNFICLDEAKELVRLAKENGADLAKAQLFDSMKLYGKKVPAELSFEDAKALFDYGVNIGIEVFFSVFDVERVKWCEEIGVGRYKLSNRRKSHLLVQAIKKTEKPVIASYGRQINRIKPSNWSYLYCVSNYPTGLSEFDLYKKRLYRFDGISDHTIGLDCAKIALALSAQIIEKHFSTTHDIGIDGAWSMTPEELRELKRFETVVKQVL